MSAAPSAPPLEVADLAVSYGPIEALHDVSLTMNRGEFVGLVGPNGAGKTTLLRTILGILTPTRGSVRVAGCTGRAAAARVGYVPQRHDFAWDYPVSVEQVVMTGLTPLLGFGRRPKQRHYEACLRALRHVAMDDLRERTIGDLSGGQRQRVLVARALAREPDLLLLDEPFTGLDQPTIDLLFDLFADLAEHGSTLLMSTHDLAGARQRCPRLVLVNRTVMADAPAAELSDADVWMRTYGVGPTSSLLASVGVSA
ncbi:MAG: anchored repeat-type ABC transporter ATP-binding subunit [Actinomycetaceae bacterium]|nr:anchored repeat-type ABC transporter ATP-binding subunit [Actinomycetaceae bacterium]MDU0970566.1 anchored repeat-type ABC transporter ATP-binding subunit [Actinomycetaceae bacterium]